MFERERGGSAGRGEVDNHVGRGDLYKHSGRFWVLGAIEGETGACRSQQRLPLSSCLNIVIDRRV